LKSLNSTLVAQTEQRSPGVAESTQHDYEFDVKE
jgi:hypothetical protein